MDIEFKEDHGERLKVHIVSDGVTLDIVLIPSDIKDFEDALYNFRKHATEKGYFK